MSANSYSLKFTPQAKADLEHIYNYIAYNLYAERAAEKAIEKIEKRILLLKTMPYSAPLYDRSEYVDFNIRKLVIDQYIAFYVINEPLQQVEIIHVLHGLMDSDAVLNNIDTNL